MVLDGNNKLSSPYSAINKEFYKHKSLPEQTEVRLSEVLLVLFKNSTECLKEAQH